MTAFAVVRDGQYLISAGLSLGEALTNAAKTFYAGCIPPDLMVLDYGYAPLPSLASLPCSAGIVSAASSSIAIPAVTLYEGVLYLVDELEGVREEQLPLFGTKADCP